VNTHGKDKPASHDSPGAHKEIPATGTPVLWREPKDIASRNLFYGAGGKEHVPHGSFTFEKEDMAGTNPKFDVIDEEGIHWKVKLGPEARPETAASRLTWAVGYFANEDYFMPMAHVDKMQHLHRGNNLVSRENNVSNLRLKRHLKDENKIGTWAWKKDPFTGTREWYGLRVLMAVMNNWDLKDTNNSIYRTHEEPAEDRYMITDLGASFGPTGLNFGNKGNVTAYCSSKLIKSVSAEFVDFNVPSGPAVNTFMDFPEFGRRFGLRWMGDLLVRLSTDQIHDAFRAAGYSPSEVEELSSTLEKRIAELEKL
jgi:hypothetical protein